MRRLMITVLAALLTGCMSFQTVQPFELQPIDTSDVLEELSFRSQLELYVIQNEYEIERMLATIDLSLPDFVREATAEDRKAIQCLAKNVYWESKHEPVRGKKAVAQVTLNRTEDPRFPDDICGVVYQRDKVKTKGRVKTICQFSWTCMSVKNKTPVNEEEWADALHVAQKYVLDGYSLPELEEALFYHADYVRPRWARQMVKIEKIGAHIFYREKQKQTAIYLASNT